MTGELEVWNSENWANNSLGGDLEKARRRLGRDLKAVAKKFLQPWLRKKQVVGIHPSNLTLGGHKYLKFVNGGLNDFAIQGTSRGILAPHLPFALLAFTAQRAK